MIIHIVNISFSEVENTTTYTYLDDEKSRVQTSSKESTYVSKSDSRGACATTSGNKGLFVSNNTDNML